MNGGPTARIIVAGVVACVLGTRPVHAQAARPHAWLGELIVLADSAHAPIARRQAAVAAIHQQVVDWLALHPNDAVDLATLPAGAWTEEQLRAEIDALRNAVAAIESRDPSQPFYLGVTVVNVAAAVTPLSPMPDSLDRLEIQNRRLLTVDQAIEQLPGVALDRKAPRNQTGISVGGFDGRQVPLYVDGTPAYLPFDGYVDLARYLTSDVAEIQVARGYASPLVGPNLLGGVINVVTRQPERPFEGAASLGGESGNQLASSASIGTRWRRFFAQASSDRLQSDFYPLSGSFAPNAQQPSGRRVNSAQRDERHRVRAAWTPRDRDAYVVSYSSQTGATGVPPYSGAAPPCAAGGATVSTPCVTPKFWKWPAWNTSGVHFHSQTGIGGSSAVQLRAFAVRYHNALEMFDDATYSSQSANANSGTLTNDDRSDGVSGQFETHRLPRHAIAASFFVKNDRHVERTTTVAPSGVAATTPPQRDRDQQSSLGVQDAIALSSHLRATVGISVDRLNGRDAQDLSGDRTRVVPFSVPGICTAGSGAFDSCTNHAVTYNPVGSVVYTAEAIGTAFVAVAHKSRFPTIKDRYSYRAGRALPNPLLRPERATTWTTGYTRALLAQTVVQAELFHSNVRDEIENTFFLSPLCAGGGRGGAGSCQQAVNVGSEIHAGVNVAVRTTAVPRLAIDAHYGFLHREITGAIGVFPTGTPTHKVGATATLRLLRQAFAVASLRHQSGTVAMSDNGLPLPTANFTTLDLAATVPIRSGVSVQAGVRNLVDRDYYYWEGFPEAGRRGYVVLRYVF